MFSSIVLARRSPYKTNNYLYRLKLIVTRGISLCSVELIKRNYLIIGLITILVTGALFFSGCAEQGVTIITDKTEYRQGDIIVITIRNNLKESILVHVKSETPSFCIKQIEMKTDEGKWGGLITSVPDCSFNMDLSRETKPGQSITFEWTPVIIDYEAKVIQLYPGRYRLSVIYMVRERTEWEFIYTNEFTIK